MIIDEALGCKNPKESKVSAENLCTYQFDVDYRYSYGYTGNFLDDIKQPVAVPSSPLFGDPVPSFPIRGEITMSEKTAGAFFTGTLTDRQIALREFLIAAAPNFSDKMAVYLVPQDHSCCEKLPPLVLDKNGVNFFAMVTD